MLNCLCTTRPKILFTVHQFAWFSIDPMPAHETAVKRIAQYLKQTMTNGLILRLDFSLSIQCIVNADFTGMWVKEDCVDLSSVYSHTGYVIMYAGCPILWVSRLQMEVTLSTTEAEYIALSQAMCNIIPFMNLVNDVSQILNIEYNAPEFSSNINDQHQTQRWIYMKITAVHWNLPRYQKCIHKQNI